MGLTQQQLAAKIHCSTIALKKIEAEERRPSAQMVERIAEVLNIPQPQQMSFLRFARGDWQSAPSSDREDTPWRASDEVRRSNLPLQMSSFVGRDKELKEIANLITGNRFVSLVGPGGVGKTRLSLKIGEQVLEDYANGVWLVELASILDSLLIPRTTAIAIGLRDEPRRPVIDMLADYLHRKKMLIILDNCEHVLDACAQLADTLLKQCPYLKILATSREALGVAGESSYPVHSLSIPNTHQTSPDILNQYDVVQLFVERAIAVQPNFQMTSQNASAIAQICARLDGIPLAIELAAARVKGLGIEQIALYLDDRFHLLTGGNRTALPRQRTLHATLDWSYELLSEAERVLFVRLSVFAGGCTLEAAEGVCAGAGIESGEVLDLLLHLVDKSLVIAEMEDTATRYHFLETIRQYAQEKLAVSSETHRVRDRHLEFFSRLARQAEPHLRSHHQLLWLDRIEAEFDNIRAALMWAADGGSVEQGLRLTTDLLWFWLYRAYVKEGREYVEELLAKPEAVTNIEVYARGLFSATELALYLRMGLRDRVTARARLEASRALWLQLGLDGKQGRAMTERALIDLDKVDGRSDLAAIRHRYEDNLKLFQEVGDHWFIANTYFSIALTIRRQGDLVAARSRYESGLELFRAIGDNVSASKTIAGLGTVAFREGNYAEARLLFEEALSYYQRVHSSFEMDIPMWMLGAIAIREEDYERAKIWYTECLRFDQQMGMNTQIPECFIGFAGIATADNYFERAVRLLAAAEVQEEVRGALLEDIDQDEFQRLANLLRAQLDETTFSKVWAEGHAMTLEQAVAYALEDLDS
jgi:predicted ATPase/DNA-binding XRE family transcriptional regulator